MIAVVAALPALATVPAADWTEIDVDLGEGSVVAGDFEGDGYDDLLFTAASSGVVEVYRGTPNGLLVGVAGYTPDLVPSRGPKVAVDIDGDTYDDLVTFSGRDVHTWYGTAVGLDDTWRHTITMPTDVRALATGDLNGDGYGDLFVSVDDPVGGGRTIYWWPGSGNGLAQRPNFSWSGGATFGTRGLAVLDANGDGFDDLALGGGGPNTRDVRVYLGTSAGASPLYWTAVGAPAGTESFGDHLVAAGDLDGDGYPDLVTTLRDPARRVWSFAFIAGGAGSLRAAVVTPGVEDHDPALAPMADADGDGDDELLAGLPFFDTAPPAGTDRGATAVLKHGGNGRFTTPVAGNFALGALASEQCGAAVLSGDFDGTGRPELVTVSVDAWNGGRIDVVYDVP